MRVNKRQTDFGAISRQSIKRDFQTTITTPQREKAPEIEKKPKINQDLRVVHVSENCSYAKFSRFIVGKLVRLVDPKGNNTTSGWYEFVFDDDRKALNRTAGWSDSKKLYLFERPKFK